MMTKELEMTHTIEVKGTRRIKMQTRLLALSWWPLAKNE
jgi:hypothetical protein